MMLITSHDIIGATVAFLVLQQQIVMLRGTNQYMVITVPTITNKSNNTMDKNNNSFRLSCDTINSVLNFLLISKIVSRQWVHGQRCLQRIQVRIQMIDQRNTSWNVEVGNGLFRDVIKILHEGAKGVAMGRNQNSLPRSNGWGYSGFPINLQNVYKALNI